MPDKKIDVCRKTCRGTRVRATREQWLQYLLHVAEERICASCWATQLEPFLDEWGIVKNTTVDQWIPLVMVMILFVNIFKKSLSIKGCRLKFYLSTLTGNRTNSYFGPPETADVKTTSWLVCSEGVANGV